MMIDPHLGGGNYLALVSALDSEVVSASFTFCENKF
jgi:hypothetical protein